MKRPITVYAAGLTLLVMPFLGNAETYQYRLSEVGKWFAHALNNSGYVTGSGDRDSGDPDAFLWVGKKPETFATGLFPEELLIDSSVGVDINNDGIMAVNAFGAGTHAFVWDGTVDGLVPLPQESGSHPYTSGQSINASGHVAGVSVMNGDFRAFIWDGVTKRDLGTLGGPQSEATGINNAGHVTGASLTESPFNWHGFHWDGTRMRDIGTLGGDDSFANAINAKGQITGTANTAGNAASHAFLWESGLMTDLGSLSGFPASVGNAINNSGQIVGIAHDGGFGTTRPFLWEKGKMRDLHNLVAANDPLKPAVTLLQVRDINNLGQILASGWNANLRANRDYLLSPVYKLTAFLSPAANSARRGTTVRVAVGLLDAANARIPDARAALLIAGPCRVQVSATGAQSLSRSCMHYNAATNEFSFNWPLNPTGTGTATIEVRVNYGSPGPLKTIKRKTITVTS